MKKSPEKGILRVFLESVRVAVHLRQIPCRAFSAGLRRMQRPRQQIDFQDTDLASLYKG